MYSMNGDLHKVGFLGLAVKRSSSPRNRILVVRGRCSPISPYEEDFSLTQALGSLENVHRRYP